MAHFEKMTFMGSRQPIKHDYRENTDKRDNIDKTLTCNNYNLAPEHDPWQFLKDKISMSKNSGGRVNTRTVACVSCVVTLPQNFKDNERLFFETVKSYLDEIFGSGNCISAWVHYDEPNAQPHLHYKFTPIAFDEERGTYQFNAKKLVSRSFLKGFHKGLDNALSKVFGRSVGVRNGATTHGNQTIEQMKKFKKVHTKYIALINEYNELVDKYNNVLGDITDLENKRLELTREVAELRRQFDKIKEENAHLAYEILGDDDFDFGR